MPRKKRNLIFPIDNRGMPEELKWITQFIEEQFIEAVKYGDCREVVWIIRAFVLHYLIKKEWWSKHKMPSVDTNSKKYIECINSIYHQAYRLCVKSFEGKLKYSEEYDHPFNRWVAIILELSLSEGRQDWRKDLSTNPDITKKIIIESLQNENQKLKEFENPFSPNSEPHTWKLIEAARIFAEQTIGEDIFYKDFWQPLLKARGAKFIREIRRPNCLISTTNKNNNQVISLPNTKGKSKVPLSDWYYRNLKKLSPLEYFDSRGYGG